MLIEVTDEQLKDPVIKHITEALVGLLKPHAEAFDLEAIYLLYPLKKGKEPGMAKLKKRIKTQAEYDEFKKCVERYAAEIASKPPAEKKFTMLWSTFVNGRWKDYLESNSPTEPTKKWTF